MLIFNVKFKCKVECEVKNETFNVKLKCKI